MSLTRERNKHQYGTQQSSVIPRNVGQKHGFKTPRNRRSLPRLSTCNYTKIAGFFFLSKYNW